MKSIDNVIILYQDYHWYNEKYSIRMLTWFTAKFKMNVNVLKYSDQFSSKL